MLYQTLWGTAFGFVIPGLLLVSLATGKAPWTVLLNTWKRLINSPHLVAIVGLMTMVLMVNKLELNIESNLLQNVVTWDYTPLVHQLEGNLTALIQSYSKKSLTSLFTFMYVFVFPALIWGSFLVYNQNGEDNMVKRLFYGFILNYIIAIPFYLFVPVNEVWYFSTKVQPLISQVYLDYDTKYRLLSGLNNCFPSLHTSISLTMALLARESKSRRWWYIAITCAVTIMFSTLYLGIHWVTDVIGGVVLAVTIVNLSRFLVENDYRWTFLWPNLARYRVLAAKRFVVAYLRKSPFMSLFF